jgi:hypothetical protein
LAVVVGSAALGAGSCGGGGAGSMTAAATVTDTSSASAVEDVAQAQCPPDVILPIPPRVCPTSRDLGAGKLQGQFPKDGPVDVMISVSGAAPVCAVPVCRGGCPAQTTLTDYWAAENFATQKCVRDLIDAVGGTSTPEQFWLVDALVATLTWEQIQIVATHPHVLEIDPNVGGPPP